MLPYCHSTMSSKKKYYSLANKLKKENKITEDFEIFLNQLTLEEVIGLKLESACKVVDGKLYGMPVWSSLKTIVNDAVLKYAYSSAKTKSEAARFLGINLSQFNFLIRKYQVKSYFHENDN